MREYGIQPVLPGYSGMVPPNAKERLKLNVSFSRARGAATVSRPSG